MAVWGHLYRVFLNLQSPRCASARHPRRVPCFLALRDEADLRFVRALSRKFRELAAMTSGRQGRKESCQKQPCSSWPQPSCTSRLRRISSSTQRFAFSFSLSPDKCGRAGLLSPPVSYGVPLVGQQLPSM